MQPDSLLALRGLCGGPRDGALLRLSIAHALLAASDVNAAMDELREALRFDPDYSAAWKLLGKTLADRGDSPAAMDAYRRGMAAAAKRGDTQAGKEMALFLRRLERQ